jgi:alpha-1,6-mannosyltransferase
VTVVATAGGQRELLDHGLSRVVHIPLGVDVATFQPSRREARQQVRARLDLPATPLAVFAGRLAREKELDVILDAWRDVERLTGARLLLVGAGPDEARLRTHPYGARVLFRPFEHDRGALADLLSACDVYVAPGPAETFGLAAVEAMACGIPVLSVERGAVGEHVMRSGAGVCYETGSAAAASRAAVTLLEADLEALGQRARAFAAVEHDWDLVFDRLFALYRDVVGTASRDGNARS